MQKLTLALAVAALFALPMSAFSQDVEIGPGGVQINPSAMATTTAITIATGVMANARNCGPLGCTRSIS